MLQLGLKNVVLLAKDNKWEGEAIDKEEKLAKAIAELNKKLRCCVKLDKAQRKAKAKVESYSNRLAKIEEKVKCELDTVAK